MKAKTIKSVLRHKHGAWLASIEDEAVRKLAADGTVITGGCIASMLLGEQVNDFDLYFRDWNTCAAVASYYVERFKKNPPAKYKGGGNTIDIWLADDGGLPFDKSSDGNLIRRGDRIKVVVKSAGVAAESQNDEYQYFEMSPDPESTSAADYVEACAAVLGSDAKKDDSDKKEPKAKFRPVFLTSNAITLSDGVQLVIRFYGEPADIHANYDFEHCMCYWQSWDGKLELPAKSLQSLLARELRYVGSKYPLCSIIRTRKFIQRGWSINAGQYVKMAVQLNDLDLCDVKVLEDQMTGVDAAYFLEIIDALKKKDDARVDRAYLLELIDAIF